MFTQFTPNSKLLLSSFIASVFLSILLFSSNRNTRRNKNIKLSSLFLFILFYIISIYIRFFSSSDDEFENNDFEKDKLDYRLGYFLFVINTIVLVFNILAIIVYKIDPTMFQ